MKMDITYCINLHDTCRGTALIGAGQQMKNPAHYQRLVVKYEYVLQYITDGEGLYMLDGITHCLHAGDLFMLPKDVLLSYRAEEKNPYTYWWIEIDGPMLPQMLASTGLTRATPVLHCHDDRIAVLFANIYHSLRDNTAVSLTQAYAYLYEALAILLERSESNRTALKRQDQDYVEKALYYIRQNYQNDVRIEAIARYLGLNRSYFFTLFRDYTGLAPSEYLLCYRIDQARKQLLSSSLSIAEIAANCGFNTPGNFSVRFKAITGMTPTQYRQLRSDIRETGVSPAE